MSVGPAGKPLRVLVFHGQKEYVHESTGKVLQTMKELGEQCNWHIETSDDSSSFSHPGRLLELDVIVFVQTSGEVLLDEEQQHNMREFLLSNVKGYMGVHSASATMQGMGWYRDLHGGLFIGHPYPQKGTVSFNTEAALALNIEIPSTPWQPVDEWYNFDTNVKDLPGCTIVATVDESTYNTEHCEREEWKGTRMGETHPIIWHHTYGRSRSFYCALGHPIDLYDDPTMRSILRAGLNWAGFRS